MSEQGTTKAVFRVGYAGKIEQHELVKRTANFVTFAYTGWNGKRCESRENASKFFDTWEAAHQSVIAKCKRDIDWHKQELHRLQSKLGQLKSEKAPS